MRRRSFMGRRRNVWGPPTVYQATLIAQSVNESTGEPCRVCGSPIWIGDPCLGRHWHVGYAHVGCGWFTPADLSYQAREAMHRVARDEPLDRDQREVLFREGWAKRVPGDIEWSERGALVYRQIVDIMITATTWKEAG